MATNHCGRWEEVKGRVDRGRVGNKKKEKTGIERERIGKQY